MKTTLSKTIDIEPVTDIELLKQAFDPIARAFCIQLQSQGLVGVSSRSALRMESGKVLSLSSLSGSMIS